MRKTILITGVAGNIGSSLAHSLCADKNNLIIGIDNLSTGQKRKIPENMDNFIFIKSDVNVFNDISGVFFTYKIDYVFHYAAVVGVKRTLNNPLMVLQDIKGIDNILNLSKNTGVKKVFFSSSSEVYGEPFAIPMNEKTTPLNSRLPYAIVKNVGEAYFRSFYKEHNLKYTIFRFFNTYGPNQSNDFVISKFIYQALNNEDLTVYGNGLQTRTFLFIKDNIDTVTKILYNKLLDSETINIGSDVEITIFDLAQLIIKLTGSKSKIRHLPALIEGDMTRRLPDNSIMMEILGRDITPLEEGIKLTIKSIIN